MNIPNILTILRLVLVPVFVIVFFSSIPNATLIALLIFLFAGLTDVLDGYLARKYNLVTKWGAILDPLADKMMSITVLLCLTVKELIPSWVLFVIGTKEALMIAGATLLFKKGKYLPAKAYGKAATALFYAAIVTLEFIYRPLGLILIYATVAATLFALYKYFKNFITISCQDVKD